MRSLTGFALLLAAILTGSMASPAFAKDPPQPPSQLIVDLKQGRITEQNAVDTLEQRGKDVASRCRMDQLDTFLRDVNRLIIHVQELGDKSTLKSGKVYFLANPVHDACNSFQILGDIESLVMSCDRLGDARKRLETLKALAENFRLQEQGFTAAGAFSTVDPVLAQQLTKSAAENYASARKLYNDAREQCDKRAREKQVGAVPDPLPDSASAQNICYPGAQTPLPASCTRWGALLGRWSSTDGAALETVLEADGTISGRIVSQNRWMTTNGYSVGMQVLRGWKPKAGSLTWLVSAERGEYFTAAMPGRKSGEIYGDPAWTRSGVLVIETRDRTVLLLPATLEGRLANYQKWRRAAPAPVAAGDQRRVPTRTPRLLDYDDAKGNPLELLLRDGKKTVFDNDRERLQDDPPTAPDPAAGPAI